VVKKATVLQELFPGDQFKYYCEVVKNSGDLPVEDLIDNFYLLKKD